jgi:hypothetical protein
MPWKDLWFRRDRRVPRAVPALAFVLVLASAIAAFAQAPILQAPTARPPATAVSAPPPSGEQMVLVAETDGADGAFDHVVVELDAAVVK